MQSSILDFDDYKTYLSKVLEERGLKQKLSEAVGFQSAFLSRVLSNLAELSLEQALKVSAHLHHTEMERDYFILLVTRDKSGSEDLRSYYNSKIEEAKKAHDRIGNELLKEYEELSEADQAVYYSSWIYQAICVYASIHTYNNAKAISKKLNIPLEQINEKLAFLLQTGLVKEKEGVLSPGKNTHGKKNSAFSAMAGHNWRIKASSAINTNREKNIHFNGVYSVTREGFEQIKQTLTETLKKVTEISNSPNEETAIALVLDLFEF